MSMVEENRKIFNVNNGNNVKRTKGAGTTTSASRSSLKSTDRDREGSVTLDSIQESIDGINKRLDKYETLHRTVDELKADIYEQDGVDHRLKYVSEQSETSCGLIADLKYENDQLRSEVDLLKALVIRMDRKICDMDGEITDLRRRSMRDNIIIHNFRYSPQGNLMKDVPQIIKEELNIDAEFIRIHRNSAKSRKDGNPVTITGKLKERDVKDLILKAQSEKKKAKIQLSFYITAQEPLSLTEQRRRLYEKSDSLRKQNISSTVYGNSIFLPNGARYKDDVPALTNSDILQMTAEEKYDIHKTETMSTDATEKDGTYIYACGARVHSHEEVRNIYKRACLDPNAASSNHRILVYRFRDEQGCMTEHYNDDGEFGAGRRLMNYMRLNEIVNVAAVIVKWDGPRYMGYERFAIMEDHVCKIADYLDDDD